MHVVRNDEITGNWMSPSPGSTTVVMIGRHTDAGQVKVSGNTLIGMRRADSPLY